MFWIIVLIWLVLVLCHQSGPTKPRTDQPVGDGEPMLENHVSARPVRHPCYRYRPDTVEGIAERAPQFLMVLATECFQFAGVCAWEILKGLGVLCVGIWWALVWSYLVSSDLLGKAWRKFNDFCRDQIDPNWVTDQKLEETQAAISSYRKSLETYRTVRVQQIEDQKLLAEAKQVAMVLEIAKAERFGQEQLALLTQELTQLVAYADWQHLSQTGVVSFCPHCGKKVLLAKKSANKIVKCPYRECRGRIKVTV